MATIEPNADPVEPAQPVGETAPPASESLPSSDAGAPTPPAAEPAPEAVDWNARIEEWGGEDSVTEAIQIADALGTEEGLRALVQEAAKVLQLPADQVEALLRGEAAAAGGDEDLDEPLTKRELDAALAREREARLGETRQYQEQVARGRVEATLSDLGVDKSSRVAVLTFAQQFVSEDETDPDVLSDAVRKGHEHYKTVIEAEAKKYLAEKEKANGGLPTPLASGGSAPATEEQPKPKNLEEAKARVRERLRQEGLLEPR